jgi:hypothetical protein
LISLQDDSIESQEDDHLPVLNEATGKNISIGKSTLLSNQSLNDDLNGVFTNYR